jgi:aspartyl protease family protein
MRQVFCALMLLAASSAWTATIYVTSVRPNEVQVIIDGRTVRTLRPGEVTPEGVKLREISGGTAVFEVGGRAIALGIGQSTVAETLLYADQRGHFVTQAFFNGVPLLAVIDTGASFVGLNAEHAQRLGIDFRRGQRIVERTANGQIVSYMVILGSVQIGDVVLANVPATIQEGGAEQLPIALIGMSFLKQVEMRRSGNTLMLSRPHLQ